MCSDSDDPSTYGSDSGHVVTIRRPSCEAKVGYSQSPYGELIQRCGQVVGVSAFLDHTGMTHYTCAVHREGMKHLWPESVA